MLRFGGLVLARLILGLSLTLSQSGCSLLSSAGLFQMSDEWCAAHPDAAARRCVGHTHA